MSKWHSPLSAATSDSLFRVGIKIVKESYNDSGICIDCIKNGGFPRICDCCNEDREFPKEFKYQLTEYAKYPGDETEFTYICSDCEINNTKKVLRLIVEADDVSEIRNN